MDKDLLVLYDKDRIQAQIDQLDRDKIHVLYFSYDLNWHNLYHTPLLLATKLLSLYNEVKYFCKRTPEEERVYWIDHVAHISRFVYDPETGKYSARLFEATLDEGMEENDLFDKLKRMRGTCYIETLSVVDKTKAREFEQEFTGVPYSKMLAFKSGLNARSLEHLLYAKSTGGFCSWLETLFLTLQGIDLYKKISKVALKIVPSDIFNAGLGTKRILYKS